MKQMLCICALLITETMAETKSFRFYPDRKLRCLVTGGAGFIGSHLARRLRAEGHWVRVADWERNVYWAESEYCDELMLLDLRTLANCVAAVEGCEFVFSLAATMGGVGAISTNHSIIMVNNTCVSMHMLEASRRAKVERFFYASSACAYPEFKQMELDSPALKESDAWPAQPENAYGLEKLYTEEMAMHYARDFGMQVRIARFHNIYGGHGTWSGGKEKAPSALCRKVAASDKELQIWGDGDQQRSFCYINDAVEGTLRLMASDFDRPLNLGTEEMVTINQLAAIVMDIAGKHLKLVHEPGPIGVRGRNSDNTLMREVLNWEPSTPLRIGLKTTYAFVNDAIKQERKKGNAADFSRSEVLKLGTATLDKLV